MISIDGYILNRNEYYTIHYNDYKDGYYFDAQIKNRLRHDWYQYLRDIFGVGNSKSKDYVVSCYRRWYARERARLLKIAKYDNAVLKQMMADKHKAVLESYEKQGYELHDCSNQNYKIHREVKLQQANEYYDEHMHRIRNRLRNKYKSESYEKRGYNRRT
jgi:phosphoglycolate phosphatase-like HAD superfamily hydrolase